MADDLPCAAYEFCDQRRVALAHGGADRCSPAHAGLVECRDEAECADAVAIIAMRIVAEIGVWVVEGPRRRARLRPHGERVPAERAHDPHCNARAAGPL